MTIETEIKLCVADPERFRRRLENFGLTLLSPRHFEDNYVLDYSDGRIRASGCLLRIRLTEKAALLTYKGVALPRGPFKSREELEVSVQNGEIALEILSRLGMQVWFRYQKYRQEYSVTVGGKPGVEVHVALDETPVGTYAELEGSEKAIRELAGKLGFGESQFLRDSYYSLYLRFCREQGQYPSHMLFGSENAERGLE